jgi:hypothetical protein
MAFTRRFGGTVVTGRIRFDDSKPARVWLFLPEMLQFGRGRRMLTAQRRTAANMFSAI